MLELCRLPTASFVVSKRIRDWIFIIFIFILLSLRPLWKVALLIFLNSVEIINLNCNKVQNGFNGDQQSESRNLLHKRALGALYLVICLILTYISKIYEVKRFKCPHLEEAVAWTAWTRLQCPIQIDVLASNLNFILALSDLRVIRNLKKSLMKKLISFMNFKLPI